MTRSRLGIVMALGATCLLAAAFVAARASRQRQLLSMMPDIPMERLNRSARKLLTQARERVEREPHRVDFWAELGYALAANGVHLNPGPCFARAEQLDPTNPRWPYLFAVAKIDTDRKLAVAALKRSLQLRPNAVAPLATLAEALLDDGALAEADALLRPVVTGKTNEPRLLLLMAQVEANAEATDRALMFAERAAAYPPPRRKLHQLLAQLYHRKGEAAKARKMARLLELLPPAEHEPPWPDEIAATAERYSRGTEVVADQARTLVSSGNFEEAIRVLDLLEKEDQRAPSVMAARAMAKAHMGDVKGAEEIFVALAAEREPNVAFAKGVVASLQKKFAEAHDAYFEAASLVPAGSGFRFVDGAHVNRGLCLLELKRNDEAAKAFNQALSLNPANVEAMIRLAEWHLGKNQRNEAAVLSEDAALLEPHNERIKELRNRAVGKLSAPSDGP
jgi:tetratricopeptide (TPR) repeat protein